MASPKRATGWIIGLAAAGLTSLLVANFPTRAEESGQSADDPMKEPLALIARAKAAYAKVDDYTCTLIKRETIKDNLSLKNVIALEVRKSPFSVFMRWREPRALKGQEVVYVAGRHDGKMRVKPSGLLGLIGWVSLAISDARAKKSSNYPITDIGIGALIQKFSDGWEAERKLGKTKVRISDANLAGSKCTCVELTHPTSAGGKLRHYRNVVYFDKKTNLLIGAKNYDWPEEEGEPGHLLEEFLYTRLKVNVGVDAADFDH